MTDKSIQQTKSKEEKPDDLYIIALLEYLGKAEQPIRLYEIKGYGKNPDYFIVDNGKVISTFDGKPYELAHEPNTSGYLRVKIRGKHPFIHCLVADAFCDNPDPERRTEAHHLDGNILNNDYRNLRHIDPFTHDLYHAMKKKYKADGELQ